MASSDYDVGMNSRANQMILEEFRLRSEVVRQGETARHDLQFGSEPAERLDLYVPGRSAEAPLIVFIHGGWWKFGFRQERAFLASSFTNAGLGFAAIGYPLAPAHSLAQICESVSRAVAWLHTRAGEHGCDGSRLLLVGNSAGGHLAAIAASQTALHRNGVPASAIRGVCGVSGLYDLAPLVGTFVEEWLHLDDETIAELSPVHQLPPMTVPVFLAVGANEPRGFHEQMEAYTGRLGAEGRSVEARALEGHSHFSIIGEITRPGSPIHQFIMGQL